MHTSTIVGAVVAALITANGVQAVPVNEQSDVGPGDVKREPQGWLEGLEDIFKMSSGMGDGVNTDAGDGSGVTTNPDGTESVMIGSTDI